MAQNSFNPLSNIPNVTKNIIIINVLLWLATVFMTKLDLIDHLGLYYPASEDFRPWQIITYMFMHGSLAHIFFNMFAVYMFGRVLENIWGQKRFLTYYLVTGIGAGLIQLFVAYFRVHSIEAQLSPDLINMVHDEGGAILKEGKNYVDPLLKQLNLAIHSSTVGASGAVFGILLAFGMLFPNIDLFIIPLPFPVKAKYVVIGYGLIELFAGIANFSFDNVAHFAHLGGMLFGIFFVLYWKKKDSDYGRYFY